MGLGDGLGLQPVKYVNGLKRAGLGKTVTTCIALGRGDRLRTLVNHMDVSCARARRVQAEAAQKTETVEDLAPAGELSYSLIIDLLIEIEPGFMTAKNIRFESKTIERDRDRAL